MHDSFDTNRRLEEVVRSGLPVRQRTVRKNVRTSSTNTEGSSIAAKWPPASSSFQCRMSVKRRSAHRREGRKISPGNSDIPDGTSIVPPPRKALKLSQYRRADDAP